MEKVFSEKTHKTLRKLQLVIAAATLAWGSICAGLDLGVAGAVITALLGAGGIFVTYLVENDSDNYFATKTIVTKILPDKEAKDDA